MAAWRQSVLLPRIGVVTVLALLQMPSLTIAKIRAMDSGKSSPAALPAAEEETTEAAPAIAVGTKVQTLP